MNRMKNAIFYYYNLNPITLIKRNQRFEFQIGQTQYIFLPCSFPLEQLFSLYQLTLKLHQHHIPVHQIILNKDRQLVTFMNQIPYILLQVYVSKDTPIIFRDILQFQEANKDISVEGLSSANWYELWTQKVDYLEYQLSEFGKKFPIIRESFSYYVGLAENAITIVKTINQPKTTISHRCLYMHSTLFDLYNPLNFIMDSKVRDVAEYIKDCFFHNRNPMDIIQFYFQYQQLQCEEYQLLFARFLFPSYYFDCYEQVIEHGHNEKELLAITLKNGEYETILKYLYQQVLYHCYLPEMLWLTKNS